MGNLLQDFISDDASPMEAGCFFVFVLRGLGSRGASGLKGSGFEGL